MQSHAGTKIMNQIKMIALEQIVSGLFWFYLMILIIRDTLLQQDQINDYVNKEVPVVNNGYYQIVDKVQRILFLQSKDIN